MVRAVIRRGTVALVGEEIDALGRASSAELDRTLGKCRADDARRQARA